MNDQTHKMAMDAVSFASQILAPHADQLAALIRAEQQMHSHVHITDPTLYHKAIHSNNLRWQVELARAALAFIQEAEKVRGEIIERQV